MVRILLFILSLSVFYNIEIQAQGCSDAGASTISTLKHSDPDKVNYMLDDYITLEVSGSKGDLEINYYSAELGYSKVITPRLRFTGRLNMLVIRGELINLSSISDLLLDADYSINDYSSLSLGVKVPFNSANEEAGTSGGNTLSLPMEYQPSLGTVDAIAGVSFSINELFLSAAVQYPVIQNSNHYSGWYSLPSTNNFERSGDMLARLSYGINLLKDKLDFIPGILLIYHLGNDTYTDSAGAERDITSSAGPTLNLTSYFVYILKGNNTLELSIGFPIKTRSSRPEGLARKYVIGFQFKTFF